MFGSREELEGLGRGRRRERRKERGVYLSCMLFG
jgi:hypothetical protein